MPPFESDAATIFAPCSSLSRFAQTLPALPYPWTATVPFFTRTPASFAASRIV